MLKYIFTAYQLHQPFNFHNQHQSSCSKFAILQVSLRFSINSDANLLELLSDNEPVLLELVC